MASGQNFSRHQQGIIKRYYEHKDTLMTQKLGEIVSDLYLCTDDKKADKLWESVRLALVNLKVEPGRVERIVTERRLEALAELVNVVSGGGQVNSSQAGLVSGTSATGSQAGSIAPQPATPGARAAASSGGQAVTPEALKSALKAFRKRLKLTRLDEESKLGRNPMSAGMKSGVVAITPPNQFPRAVWEELVKQGKLKQSSGGMYELIE